MYLMCVSVCFYAHMNMCEGIHVEVRGQVMGVKVSLDTMWILGVELGCQVW